MKTIKYIYRVMSILSILFLLTGCSTNSLQANNAELDLKLKSSDRFFSPLCDDIDINKSISVNKGNINNDEVIKALMTTLFDRYTELNDSSVKIEEYLIKKIDMVLETKKGSVFGVLYSVKGTVTRTRWDLNEQSDKWTTTQKIYCSYFEQGDKYILNIIGENPLYYKGNEDKLSTEEIAKKLFEDCLEPAKFNDNKRSRLLLSYRVDKVEPYVPGDNTKHRLLFNIDYSVQGVKGESSFISADEEGRGSLNSNWELISIGDFYEIKGAD